jgi:hypothetical protein
MQFLAPNVHTILACRPFSQGGELEQDGIRHTATAPSATYNTRISRVRLCASFSEMNESASIPQPGLDYPSCSFMIAEARGSCRTNLKRLG